METTHNAWTSKAEAAILALRDIEGVSIQADGDEIREVHILTTSKRPAKQIVRDVQTLLLTRFGRTIDHRVVSVAYTENQARETPGPAAPVAQSTPAPADAEAELAAEAVRVRFVSANVYVSGPRVQAQVELKWKGVPRMGSASGWSTRDGAHRLIVTATLAAVQEYLEDDVAVGLDGIDIVRIGGRKVAVVCVSLIAHRERKTLVGSCTVGQDSQQAFVLATLDALNRVVGGLPAREPTEYILRPTST